MRLDTSFRLFNHATLALSCACLLLSEQQFMPAPELAIAPVAGLVFLAFLVEKRWVMPDNAANLFGILIALSGVWWMLDRVYSTSGPVILPLPTGLVPQLGPIVMALLLVKLFRPRQPVDFWVLQGMGLLQVALACVLDADPRFGLYFAGYVGCGLTCLALHHTTSAELKTDAGSGVPVLERRTPARLFFRPPLLWTPIVGILAGVLFLATPRGNWPSWDPMTRFGFRPGTVRAQTGFVPEINLNRTGELELDDEAAFMVTATDANDQPKIDLSREQRWRGTVLELYQEGRWFVLSERGSIFSPNRRFRFTQDRLPDFGPAQFFLTFQIQPRRAGGLFLAEPIRLGSLEARLPVLSVSATQPPPFFEFSGTVLPIVRASGNEYRYRQVIDPDARPDRIPADRLVFHDYTKQLLAPPPAEIQTWTREMLRQFAEEGRCGLTREDLNLDRTRETDTLETIPVSAERVARALCGYLSESRDFTYSLDLRRQNPEADPAVDFLLNVREGHCERFATGLVLMLRGCGIPARVVKGFRGAEHQGDGVYVVRHCDAHSWVEALVPRPASPRRAAQICALAGTPRNNLFLTVALASAPERVSCDWLMLDPTPANGEEQVPPFSLLRWWQHQWRQTDRLWQELILRFNAEQQADLWSLLTASRGPGPALLRLLVLVVAFVALTRVAWWIAPRLPGWWAAWRTRAVRKKPPAPPTWLARLFGLLARYLGVQPGPGQTPRETAACAAAVLRAHSAAAALAELPGRVVELYYRFRYGDRPLSDDERRAVEEELARLESALRTAPAVS